MEIINSIIHPQKFLGLTDLRIGTMILAFVNFVCKKEIINICRIFFKKRMI